MITNTLKSFRRGLTMLELVFVIVILGIVASIGSSIIVQVYESYLVQRGLHRASVNAELAAMQVANRLTYRISSSVIGRVPGTATFKPIDQLLPVDANTHTALEWIAYDNDSFSAQTTPGWSGFCDVNLSTNANATTKTNIFTPGSNLADTNAIIGNLSDSTKTIADAAIIFAGREYNTTLNYNAACMGFTSNTCISPVSAGAGTSITVEDNNPKVMTDQYKLAWSAYAVVPTQVTGTDLTDRGFQAGDEIYDLALHYNYQPWDNAPSSYAQGESSTLIENVVSFRFIGKGDTIRFKICVQENIGFTSSDTIEICKEKAVIR